MSSSNMEPFVKWAGGKRQMLEALRIRMPDTWKHYYEPFVGGGALMFHQKPACAFINDINRELIHTYTEILYKRILLPDAGTVQR